MIQWLESVWGKKERERESQRDRDRNTGRTPHEDWGKIREECLPVKKC